MKRLSFCAVLAVLPSVLDAQDGCPTAADLSKRGIAFTVDGEVEVHTRSPNGVITVISQEDAEGIAVKSVLAHGVHVLQLSDLENGKVIPGSVWRFAFPVSVADMPVPTAGGSWQVQTTSMIDGVSEVEVVSHSWGEAAPYTIGDCTYTGIPGRADFDGESYDHFEDTVYFPDLGTAVLIAYGDNEGTDRYDYTDIRAQ